MSGEFVGVVVILLLFKVLVLWVVGLVGIGVPVMSYGTVVTVGLLLVLWCVNDNVVDCWSMALGDCFEKKFVR